MTRFMNALFMGVVLCCLVSQAVPAATIDRPFNSSNGIAALDEDSTFPGIWRGSMQLPNVKCQTEYVFQSNHKYSYTAVCGQNRIWQTGNWRVVKEGLLHFEILDYEPKTSSGRKVYVPDSDSLSYRIVNKNQIHLISTVQGLPDSELYRAGK